MTLLKSMKYKIRYFFLKRKLSKNIDTGKIIPTSERHRGIGTTTALIEISKQYNIPIIVNFKWHEIFLKEKGVEVYAFQSLDNLRGVRFKNGVLIEEGLNDSQIRDLLGLGIRIRTGFYYNPLFI